MIWLTLKPLNKFGHWKQSHNQKSDQNFDSEHKMIPNWVFYNHLRIASIAINILTSLSQQPFLLRESQTDND